MKEELNKFKEFGQKYKEAKKEFEAKREIFNLNFERNITDEDVSSFLEDECIDSYDIACFFEGTYGLIFENAAELKKSHPRYGEKRFKNELITSVIDAYHWDYEEDFEATSNLVSVYMLIDKCGFNEVKEAEEKEFGLREVFQTYGDLFLTQISGTITNAGKNVANSVVNIVKPYGEVAKGQMETVGEKAKEVVNKGTKRLIKTLEKIDDKTSKKDN